MTFMDNLQATIEAAEAEAARGCGCSDVLYEARVQNAYAGILEQAPEADRTEAEAILRNRGYDPERAPYEAEEGYCSVTGIEFDCCPCGNHE